MVLWLDCASPQPRDGHHNTTQHSIAKTKRWTTQHKSAQHNITHHNTTQHNSTQYRDNQEMNQRTRPPSHSQDRNHRIITSILKMLTILKTLLILRSCRWARILVCLYDDDDDGDGHHHRHHRWAWIHWGSTGLWPCPPLTTPHLPHSTQRTQYQLQYSIPNATWHAIQYQMILSQCCYNI